MITQVQSPTLLLDADKCRENMSVMGRKAAKCDVGFRPHFKTHQSRIIGGWYRDLGVRRITVSSMDAALYFADAGFSDITVAFPVNPREAELIGHLASRITLNVLVVDGSVLELLDEIYKETLGVFIKIDCGYGRTGIRAEDESSIASVIGAVDRSKSLRFTGLLTHAGHSYSAPSRAAIVEIHRDTLGKMGDLAARFKRDFPRLIVSVGDTPCCSLANDFEGADEIRPGNFVFYDLTQLHLGTCTFENIAVALACPVVARYPERGEVVVHGGAVHLSKDQLTQSDGRKSFGMIVKLADDGWGPPVKGAYVRSVSQEHGVVVVPPVLMDRLKIGSALGVIPVHSCLTADAMKGYITLDGDVVDHLEGSRP